MYVAGEDEPLNAKVLGVSECSDLAVIDIEGEGYPHFEWHSGAISVGTDVYTAGFPLGDPEFTLTRGSVPTEWDAVNGAGWAPEGEVVGPGLSASSDLDAFNNTWGEPRAYFGASSSLVQSYSVDGMLDLYNYATDCEKDARYDYQDQLYTGKYDVWVNCGEERSSFAVLAAVPENQEFIAVVQILIVSDAEVEATNQILSTFEVVGNV